MNYNHQRQLMPRDGHKLVVGIVARISGCANQKDVSLSDQIDHAKQVVAELYDGPVEFRVIATRGKGESLERPELGDIEKMLRTRELDLLVAEDIGRIVRGAEASWLCGIAVDHGTRVIAPNDCIDTADDTWEEDVIQACRDHVGHNAHTSKRLKQKLMNRFMKSGGAVPLPIMGYITPPGAKTYDDWQKDPAATPVYREWFAKLKNNPNCSALADWLEQKGIPTGKYTRRKRWDGAMVRRLTRNPLLKGMPGRGFKHTVKHNETGRRIAVKNPRGPQFKEYSHLTHVESELFDEVNALLNTRNRGFGRKPVNEADPLSHVPRKRTRFPGQHVRCWYCGRQYVWGGNGTTKNLMCNGARQCRCWNSIGFKGSLACRNLFVALLAQLCKLEGFDDQFRSMVEQARLEGGDHLKSRWDVLEGREASQEKEKQNVMDAIAAYGPQPMFEERLSQIEMTGRELSRERRELERSRQKKLDLPDSTADLRRMLEQKFVELAVDSPEFGDLMRQLVPKFEVYLVRLLDGGHLLPRARVKLNLAGIVPDAKLVPGMAELLSEEATIDLFEQPQRERIRLEVVRMAELKFEQREIARQIPEKPTQAAVSRAIRLDRMIHERGLDSPYGMLADPPSDYGKLRRHLNAKYKFEPEDGYQRTAL
jgi:site-specific DNA recombinase